MRIALLLVQAVTCVTQTTSGEPRSDTTYARIVAEAVAAGVPGLQAYVKRGRAEWRGAAGLSSVERRTAMTTTDRVRVASLTKMMTYATVMQLARQGRLRLTDRAVSLLPAGTLKGIPHADEITVEQLLEHTSGLHNFNGENGADFFRALFDDPRRGDRLWTPRELIAFARTELHSPTGSPGERRAYSSTGYMVLHLILEHVGQVPLLTLYRSELFAPLGMTRSGLEGADLAGDSIVPAYAVPAPRDRSNPSPFGKRPAIRGDGLVNVSADLRWYNTWAGAAGGVATTVDDLARFMTAVVRGERLVLRDQRTEFERVRARPGVFLSWNGGSWGIQASILYEPGCDITVIVLSNASNIGTGTQTIAQKLMTAARDDDDRLRH